MAGVQYKRITHTGPHKDGMRRRSERKGKLFPRAVLYLVLAPSTVLLFVAPKNLIQTACSEKCFEST